MQGAINIATGGAFNCSGTNITNLDFALSTAGFFYCKNLVNSSIFPKGDVMAVTNVDTKIFTGNDSLETTIIRLK